MLMTPQKPIISKYSITGVSSNLKEEADDTLVETPVFERE